jgi:hypothetical protein
VSPRVVVVSLVIVCSAVAAIVLLRGGDGDPARPAPTEPRANPEPTPALGSTPISRERPEVRVVPPAAKAPMPSLPFAEEVIDREFSSARTAEVRITVAEAIAGAEAIGVVRLTEVECRSQRCQLTLAAEGEGLAQVMARLEDERGFYGKASELALHDAVMGADGTPQQVSMTLLFPTGDGAPD